MASTTERKSDAEQSPAAEKKMPRALDFATGQSRIPEDDSNVPGDRHIYFPGQEEANVPDAEDRLPSKEERLTK